MQIVEQYKKEIADLTATVDNLNNAKLQALSQLNEMRDKITQYKYQITELSYQLKEQQRENEKLKLAKNNLNISIEEMKCINNNNINTMKSALDYTNQEKNQLNLKIKQLQNEKRQQYETFINKYEIIKQERDKLLLQLGNNNSDNNINNGSNDSIINIPQPPSESTSNKINPLSFYSKINTIYSSNISKYIIELIKQIKPTMDPNQLNQLVNLQILINK